MSLSYLQSKPWWQISRDERFFCAELYREIHAAPVRFIHWLGANTPLTLDSTANWEVSVEVCFYRDFLTAFRPKLRQKYSPKRTFDLCLFSEHQIVIIEAKAHQEMRPKDADTAKRDVELMCKLLGGTVDIFLLALVASEYARNHERRSRKRPLDHFNAVITWKQLQELFGNCRFARADKLYKDQRHVL